MVAADKKTITHLPRSRRGTRHEIAARLEAKTSVTADPIHIKATRKDKHGNVYATARKNPSGEMEWSGPLEWAQIAIGVLRSQGKLPPNILFNELVDLVHGYLDKEPGFKNLKFWRRRRGSIKVDAKTIEKAADIQKIAYRSVRGRPKKKPGSKS